MTNLDITYDRSERQYRWIDPDSGEIFSFPSGKAGKAQAFQFAVSMLDPDLWTAAQNWLTDEPYLERVVMKAVELVAGDGVETFPGNGRLLAMVSSSDEYGRYSVGYEDGYIVCECVHWQDGHAPIDQYGQRTCKHVAAVHLHNRVRETRF